MRSAPKRPQYGARFAVAGALFGFIGLLFIPLLLLAPPLLLIGLIVGFVRREAWTKRPWTHQPWTRGVSLHYLGGHPGIGAPTTCRVGREGEELWIMAGPQGHVARIPRADLKRIHMDKKDARSLGKAVAGAVVGGLAAGGVGTLAGVVLGGRRTDSSVIVLDYEYNGAMVGILFDGDDIPRKYSRLVSLLQ